MPAFTSCHRVPSIHGCHCCTLRPGEPRFFGLPSSGSPGVSQYSAPDCSIQQHGLKGQQVLSLFSMWTVIVGLASLHHVSQPDKSPLVLLVVFFQRALANTTVRWGVSADFLFLRQLLILVILKTESEILHRLISFKLGKANDIINFISSDKNVYEEWHDFMYLFFAYFYSACV